ncbi:hypothetical protein AB9K41_18420, partial [Cribrihabitans sp. XS_ASV171]
MARDPTNRYRTFGVLAGLLCVLLARGIPVYGQSGDGVLDASVAPVAKTHEEASVGFRNGSFVVAPIPFSNPTIGSGLAVGLGYLFQFDETSKPSMIGIGGLRSDNGSRAAGVAGNFYFRENRWILKLLAAEADVKYDLY